MIKKENLLIQKYLKEHSLVESNILSFNDFIENKMQQIIDDMNKNLSNEEMDIKIGKIKIGKPNVIESDGSMSVLTPAIAKLRNLTYSAPIYVDLSVHYGEHSDESEVEIGRIPIIVRSSACTTSKMSEQDLLKNYMDPKDSGGYFIINGNERVIVMSEDLAPNQPFIEEGR